MGTLSNYLGPNSIQFLNGLDKSQALAALCAAICKDSGLECMRVCPGIAEREGLMATGIGLGIALPHVRLPQASKFVIGLGISKQGIDYGSLDKKPVHIILMMVGPARSHDEYLQLMARTTLVLRQEACRQAILASNTPEEARAAIDRF
jgi:mannitol/fructose-specific phosphotransferase system IIA component (Ntr-type)